MKISLFQCQLRWDRCLRVCFSRLVAALEQPGDVRSDIICKRNQEVCDYAIKMAVLADLCCNRPGICPSGKEKRLSSRWWQNVESVWLIFSKEISVFYWGLDFWFQSRVMNLCDWSLKLYLPPNAVGISCISQQQSKKLSWCMQRVALIFSSKGAK